MLERNKMSDDIIVDHCNAAETLGNTELSGMSCLEEFIENSISAGADRISIYIYWEDPNCDYLIFEISDNGCGIDRDTLKTRVFSIGQSGLRDQNKMSIHGFGGLASLYVIQVNHPDWSIETKSNDSLNNNMKYIVNGPITNSKPGGIKFIDLNGSESKSTGTIIKVKIDRCMFLPTELNDKNRFDYFIKRIHERFGVKYYELLKNRDLIIEVNWIHSGEPKQERGRSASGEEKSLYHPPAAGSENIIEVDWRSLVVSQDDLPIPRAISDKIHGLTHSQHCSKLIEHFTEDRALVAGLRNHHIFSLKNHYQNVTNPLCFYIYYRGMLIDNFRLGDVKGANVNTRVFDYSKFVSVIELDENTDPKVTNIIKNKGKTSHPQYNFVLNEISRTLKDDLKNVFPKDDLHERDIKKQMVEFFNNHFAQLKTNARATLEEGIKFGSLDIVITDDDKKTKTIIEVKRGRAESKDFLQIKDYKEQIEISSLYNGYQLEYWLVAESYAAAVLNRCKFFRDYIDLKLKKLVIVNERYSGLEDIIN